MKIKNLLFSFLILSICIFILPAAYSHAKDEVKTEEQKLKEEIEEISEEIADLRGRASSLSNEIQYMDSQISLTELKIRSSQAKIIATEKEITKLAGDITDLSKRIDKLILAIDHQKVVLNSRFREQYKIGDTSPFVVFFGSSTINSIIQKTKYLEIMEYQDNKMMEEMESVKVSYHNQKNLFEEKKHDEELLKNQLDIEKQNLDAQKNSLLNQQSEKKRLLEVTQNDEEKYQELLAEAKRELNQIQNAAGVLKNQDAKHVKKGEAIGIQGNTGFSSGEHLHFGVYKYSSFDDIDGWNWYYSNYIDPAKMLKSKTVYWDTGCESAGSKKVGKGDWAWPLSDPTVSQGFGHTCWSNIYYGGKDHPALDMYGSYGSIVYAADDGDAYFCRNCLGDGANGVFVFHDDDYMTVYWHLR